MACIKMGRIFEEDNVSENESLDLSSESESLSDDPIDEPPVEPPYEEPKKKRKPTKKVFFPLSITLTKKAIKLRITPEKNEVIPLNDKEKVQTFLGGKVTYIYDKEEKATELIGLTKSPVGGLGAVSTGFIAKDEELGKYQGNSISLEELAHKGVVERPYVMEVLDDEGEFIEIIDAELSRNFAGFLNQGHPNVVPLQKNGEVVFKAIEDIPPGTPLLYHYGPSYRWEKEPFYLTKYHVDNVDALYERNKEWYEQDCYMLPESVCDLYYLPKGRYWKITSLAKAILQNEVVKKPKEWLTQAEIPCLLVTESEEELCNFKNQPLLTPLQIAVAKADPRSIDKLLASKCDPHIPSILSQVTPALALLRVLFQLQDSDSDIQRFEALKRQAITLIELCTLFIDDKNHLNLLDAAIRLADIAILKAVLNCIKNLPYVREVNFTQYLIERNPKLSPFADLDYCILNGKWEVLDVLLNALEDNCLVPENTLEKAIKANKILQNHIVKNLSDDDKKQFMETLQKHKKIYDFCVNKNCFPIKNIEKKPKKWVVKPKEMVLMPVEVAKSTEPPPLPVEEQEKVYKAFRKSYTARHPDAILDMIQFAWNGFDGILSNVFTWMKAKKIAFDTTELKNIDSLSPVWKKYVLLRASSYWDLPPGLIDQKISIVHNYTENEQNIFSKIYLTKGHWSIEELSVLLNYNRTNKSKRLVIPTQNELFDEKLDETIIQKAFQTEWSDEELDETLIVEEIRSIFQEVFFNWYNNSSSKPRGKRHCDWSKTHDHLKNPYGVYTIENNEKTYTFSLSNIFKYLKAKDRKTLAWIVSQFMSSKYLLSVNKTKILIAYFRIFDLKEGIEPIVIEGESTHLIKQFWSNLLSSREETEFKCKRFTALKKICKSGNKDDVDAYLAKELSDLKSFESKSVIREVLYPIQYGKRVCFVLDVLLEHLNDNAERLIYWLLRTDEFNTLRFVPDALLLAFLRTNQAENFHIFIKSYLDKVRLNYLVRDYLCELDSEAFLNCKKLFKQFELLKIESRSDTFYKELNGIFTWIENTKGFNLDKDITEEEIEDVVEIVEVEKESPKKKKKLSKEEKESSKIDLKPPKQKKESSKENRRSSKEKKKNSQTVAEKSTIKPNEFEVTMSEEKSEQEEVLIATPQRLEKLERERGLTYSYTQPSHPPHRKIEEDSLNKLAVVLTPALGSNNYGAITTRRIEKGETVALYFGKVHINPNLKEGTYCYLVSAENSIFIDATNEGGIGRYINHSSAPTLEPILDIRKDKNKTVVKFKALQTIQPYSEVFYDYTFNYFSERHQEVKIKFLHPNDWEIDGEVLKKDSAFYKDKTYYQKPINFEKGFLKLFGLSEDAKFWAPEIVFLMMQGEEIKPTDLNLKQVNSICFLLNDENEFSHPSNQPMVTPLMIACYLGNEAYINFLVKNGADVKRVTRHTGIPALGAAFVHDYEKIIAIKKSLKIKDCGDFERTLFFLAVQESKIEYLIDYFEIKTFPDGGDHFAWMYPEHSHMPIFAGVNVDYSLQHADFEIAELLLKNMIDLDVFEGVVTDTEDLIFRKETLQKLSETPKFQTLSLEEIIELKNRFKKLLAPIEDGKQRIDRLELFFENRQQELEKALKERQRLNAMPESAQKRKKSDVEIRDREDETLSSSSDEKKKSELDCESTPKASNDLEEIKAKKVKGNSEEQRATSPNLQKSLEYMDEEVDIDGLNPENDPPLDEVVEYNKTDTEATKILVEGQESKVIQSENPIEKELVNQPENQVDTMDVVPASMFESDSLKFSIDTLAKEIPTISAEALEHQENNQLDVQSEPELTQIPEQDQKNKEEDLLAQLNQLWESNVREDDIGLGIDGLGLRIAATSTMPTNEPGAEINSSKPSIYIPRLYEEIIRTLTEVSSENGTRNELNDKTPSTEINEIAENEAQKIEGNLSSEWAAEGESGVQPRGEYSESTLLMTHDISAEDANLVNLLDQLEDEPFSVQTIQMQNFVTSIGVPTSPESHQNHDKLEEETRPVIPSPIFAPLPQIAKPVKAKRFIMKSPSQLEEFIYKVDYDTTNGQLSNLDKALLTAINFVEETELSKQTESGPPKKGGFHFNVGTQFNSYFEKIFKDKNGIKIFKKGIDVGFTLTNANAFRKVCETQIAFSETVSVMYKLYTSLKLRNSHDFRVAGKFTTPNESVKDTLVQKLGRLLPSFSRGQVEMFRGTLNKSLYEIVFPEGLDIESLLENHLFLNSYLSKPTEKPVETVIFPALPWLSQLPNLGINMHVIKYDGTRISTTDKALLTCIEWTQMNVIFKDSIGLQKQVSFPLNFIEMLEIDPTLFKEENGLLYTYNQITIIDVTKFRNFAEKTVVSPLVATIKSFYRSLIEASFENGQFKAYTRSIHPVIKELLAQKTNHADIQWNSNSISSENGQILYEVFLKDKRYVLNCLRKDMFLESYVERLDPLSNKEISTIQSSPSQQQSPVLSEQSQLNPYAASTNPQSFFLNVGMQPLDSNSNPADLDGTTNSL
ncbi:SET domain-containing protein-lysine N-methyltransferase [Legionella cardiaca]|uniref:SET domain-containing protein-lysine N-methyltransferase n=1 Tax=Legionella cardiaca TaxID=1071983 RepID=A0ABY8AXW9_9GAMM|nr:SET domain-containing protein-lysine N-methyltransferase [Legionella cardiaca]WED43992.1 SET domain-containing protein-lysine N-methyltransferase [Legionella cardiaca]